MVKGYANISDIQLWQTVTEDLPPLEHVIRCYIDETDWNEWACTIPEVGIFAVRGALTSMTKELEESGMALLQHEFGHILQYRGWKKAYWPLVAKESVISAKSHNSTHHKFWTETWANYLSKEYFGERWLGTYTRFKKWYPAVNISPENLKRVESF